MAHHLGAAHAAKGTQRGHEVDRFEDVRLALRVVAEQQVKAGLEIRIEPRVIAEVAKSQMGQMHSAKMNSQAVRREIFSRWRTGDKTSFAHVKSIFFDAESFPVGRIGTADIASKQFLLRLMER